MKYYVIINGESSLDIQGLVISKLPDISKPLMRNEKIEIDGRDGDIITKLGYSAYDKTIEIGLWGTYDIDTIIEYFNQDGVITFSNEIDKYYNFSILNREDFINKLEKFKTASITLHCQPFKYEVNEETKEIENEYVERTGTSISLSNTLSAPMEIDLKGNTQQEQLSGKNLIDVSKGRLGNFEGFTFTSSNGELIVNGTNDRLVDVYLYIADQYNIPLVNFLNNKTGTYTLSNDKGYETYFRLQSGFKQTTATISPQDTTINCFIRIPAGTYNNLSIKVQLEKGSTATSYEQYCGGIPSPNPDYPQDVNVVSGNNNIVVCGKNLFDKSNATILNAVITSSTIGNNASNKTTYYKCLPNTTYTVSKIAGNRFKVALCSSTTPPTIGTTTGTEIENHTASNITITTESNTTYLAIWYYNSADSVSSDEMLNSIQIEQGNQATTYEPYTETTYPINLPVKNIMNIPDGTGTRGNNTFTALNQEITLNSNTSGTESAFYLNDVSQTSTYAASSYSNARDYNMTSTGGTYTLTTYFSYKPEYNFQVYLFTNKRLIRKTTNDDYNNGKLIHNITLDSDEYIKSIQCYTNPNNVFDNLKITTQLEEGSNTNAYHPYGTTPIELCKIGTYQDYFYKDSGKWYLHKETFNITLDGTESSWAVAAAGWYSQSFTSIIKKSSPALSKQYTYTSSTWQGNYTFSINASGFIAISDNRYPVRTDWINYLSNNNVDMLCVLDTPTNTEITDTTLIEQLEAIASATSYEGETNINQVNNDLPFIITASIFTGTDTITIENKGNTTAKPTMTIYGKGTIGVYLNGNQVFTINLGDEEYITIDTQNMEASKDTILKNRLVVGDYNSFVLQTGNNTLKFTGLVNKVEINNYSRWV